MLQINTQMRKAEDLLAPCMLFSFQHVITITKLIISNLFNVLTTFRRTTVWQLTDNNVYSRYGKSINLELSLIYYIVGDFVLAEEFSEPSYIEEKHHFNQNVIGTIAISQLRTTNYYYFVSTNQNSFKQ
jgi:hypothetical protein